MNVVHKPFTIPVIVGVGEITDKFHEIEKGLEPIELMAEALHRAEWDSGIKLLKAVDSIDIVAQNSWPYPDTLALLSERLKIQPRCSVYGEAGGESPVRFIHEAALRIARGESKVAAIVGAESSYTVYAASKAGINLPWSPCDPHAKLLPDADIANEIAVKHGMTSAVSVYPLYENASQAAWGQTQWQALTLQLNKIDNDFLELRFDREADSVNRLDRRTLDELREAIGYINGATNVRGVLINSAKEVFIVGADITEFAEMFKLTVHNLSASAMRANQVFMAFEDLKVPTVVAINGSALGGGLEMALSGAFRVMASTAQIGLPEVKLGLVPGFGGTVRMPRIAGPAVAVDWITSGKANSAAAAKAAGVVDEICAPEMLRATALELLEQAATGAIDWRIRQRRKLGPLA